MPSETESRKSSLACELDSSDCVRSNDGEITDESSENVESMVVNEQVEVLKARNFPLGKKHVKSKLHLHIVTDEMKENESDSDDTTEEVKTAEADAESVPNGPSIDIADDDLEKPFTVTKSLLEVSHKSAIYAAAFNPYVEAGDTQFLATGAKNIISIYEVPLDCDDMKIMRFIVDDNNEESFFTVAWAYDPHLERHLLLAAGHTGYIKVIDPMEGTLVKSIWGHGESVNEIRTDPNNSAIFASVSKDNTVRLWNVRVSSCLVIMGGVEGHLDQVISCDWSPDSYFLVSCGMDHSIRMWYLSDEARNLINLSMTLEGEQELEKKEEQRTIHINFPNSITSDLHCDYVDCVRFLGWHIVSKGSEKAANLFRFGHLNDEVDHVYTIKSDSTCSRIGVMSLPRCDVWFLKFDIDPALRWLAFGATGGFIYFFDILNREIEIEAPDYEIKVGDASIRQVCFGAGGRILIAVDDNHTVTRIRRNTKSGRFEPPKKKCQSIAKANGKLSLPPAAAADISDPEVKRRKVNNDEGMSSGSGKEAETVAGEDREEKSPSIVVMDVN